ncbi:hypothetical protein GOC33_24305 [Sinorhizobium meliloti]|nr:hypothetical protein [Sinorhizobium meliloti]
MKVQWQVNDSLKKGADLGALMMRGRVMDDEFELTERACNWITGIGEDGHGPAPCN